MVRKLALPISLALAAGLITMQFVPVGKAVPASEKGGLSAPPEIQSTLRRSCYDCHSDETHWPWYSRVAPLSWIVAHDTEIGRKEINFSRWNDYRPEIRRRKLQWIRRSLQEEGMPPWNYRLIHPESRLTDEDRAAVGRWIDTELGGDNSAAMR